MFKKLNEMKKFTSVKDPYYETITGLISEVESAGGNIRDAQEEVRMIMRKLEREDPIYDGLLFVENMLKCAAGRISTN